MTEESFQESAELARTLLRALPGSPFTRVYLVGMTAFTLGSSGGWRLASLLNA